MNEQLKEAVSRLEMLAHEFQHDGENKTDFAVSAAYANAARIVRKAFAVEVHTSDNCGPAIPCQSCKQAGVKP